MFNLFKDKVSESFGGTIEEEVSNFESLKIKFNNQLTALDFEKAYKSKKDFGFGNYPLEDDPLGSELKNKDGYYTWFNLFEFRAYKKKNNIIGNIIYKGMGPFNGFYGVNRYLIASGDQADITTNKSHKLQQYLIKNFKFEYRFFEFEEDANFIKD